jgi:hypothetical protein
MLLASGVTVVLIGDPVSVHLDRQEDHKPMQAPGFFSSSSQRRPKEYSQPPCLQFPGFDSFKCLGKSFQPRRAGLAGLNTDLWPDSPPNSH